jgi:hypothetical protein
VSAQSLTIPAPTAPSAAPPRDERRVLLIAGLYFLCAALILTIRLWRDPASLVVAGNPADADQAAWYFRYDASAVAHFHLPALFTAGMNAPQGVSVMWNTFMLLPGILLAPLTLLAGPQVSLTVLMTLGFAGAALALFAVARRWGASMTGAALAGAVYGFSPAMIQSAVGHYDLQFAVLPPLIIDAALRLLLGRAGSDKNEPDKHGAVRRGLWLGLLTTAQVFINEELVFDAAIAVVIITVVLLASRPRALVGRLRETAVGLAAAALVGALIAGYPLAVQFFGPLREHDSPFTPDFYKNDLAAFVQPSSLELLHTPGSAAFANAFQGGAPEYLAYLGWPMLAVLLAVAVLFWPLLTVRVTAVTFAVLSVFSLGGTLLAGGDEHEAFKLPWYLLQTLPVTGSVIPDRFSLLADGAAAATLAFGLDAALRRWPRQRALPVIVSLATAAVLPLVPVPLPSSPTVTVPAGWTTVFTDLRLPADARVLVVPIPVSTFTAPLRWVADTGENISLVGGYFMGPTYTGAGATDGSGLDSEAMYFNQLWAQSAKYPVSDVATVPPIGIYPSAIQMRGQIKGWKVSAVVAVTGAHSAFGSYLTSLLGKPTVEAGEVLSWRTS